MCVCVCVGGGGGGGGGGGISDYVCALEVCIQYNYYTILSCMHLQLRYCSHLSMTVSCIGSLDKVYIIMEELNLGY